MADINPGDMVRVSTTPGFMTAAGTPTDPTTVSLRWRAAGGTETTWVFGVASQVVKDSVGLYHADIPVVGAGLHYFRWVGSGAVTASEEGTFDVKTSFIGSGT